MPTATSHQPTPTPPVNLDAQRQQAKLDAELSKLGIKVDSMAPVPAPSEAPLSQSVISQAPPQFANEPAPAPAQQLTSVPPDSTRVEAPYDWEGERKRIEKQMSDARSALAPALQRAALAEKKIAERDEVLNTLMGRFEALERKLTEPPPALARPLYDPSLDDDFASMNPEVAERLARVSSGFDQKLQETTRRHEEEMRKLKEAEAERERERQEGQFRDFHTRWWAAFRAVHPDSEDYAPGQPKGQAFWEWSQGQNQTYQQALAEPLKFDPRFVAKILTEFKDASNPAPNARTPIADLANPSLMGGTPIAMQQQAPPSLLRDDEMKNIYTLVDRALRSGNRGEAARLEDGYKATLAYYSQQR